MRLEKFSIAILLMASMVFAWADPGQGRGDRDGQRDRREQRAQDQGNRQFGRVPQDVRQAGTPDDRSRHSKLSPEERRDLRRQINEAGQDIYVPRR